MAFNGTLEQYVRFDVSPQELLMLQEKEIVVVDSGLEVVSPRRLHVTSYLRDDRFSEPDEPTEQDNLLKRPRYRETPTGLTFTYRRT
jgi:hypothetical protein